MESARKIKSSSVHQDFNLPSKGSIAGRTSSITAAFFQSITPVIRPTHDEVEEVLSILGLSAGNVVCAYCGDPKTEWDHFRPTVVNKQPTGFITEIANLVPACGKCNQSKGNKSWKTWILSDAKKSPKIRKPIGLEERILRLETFSQWREPVKIDYASISGESEWKKYMDHLANCEAALREGELLARKILVMVRAADS